MRHLYAWIEERTGIASAVRRLAHEDIPASAGWPQVFGSVALFLFLVQALTGMLLGLNYAGSPGDAYDSIIYITRDVIGGRLVRGLHHWGASMMVAVVALHAAQVFLYAAYKKPREVTWTTGVFLFLFVLAFGLTGYLLPWDNRAYWGTVVTTQIAGQMPVLGRVVQRAIGAERGVGVTTFSRFYALHVLVLPAITVLLIGAHLLLVRKHGVTPGASRNNGARPFYPEQVLKDTLAIFLAFTLLFAAAVFLDAPLDRLADPTDSAYVPRPEWYFLFLFQLLTLFHGPFEWIASVGLPFLAVTTLFLIPFFDRGIVRAVRQRTWAIAALSLASASWGALTLAGVAGTAGKTARSGPIQRQQVLRLAPDELAGLEYFRREQCQRCHNLLDGEPKVGPNLAVLESRRSPEWMESHFRKPGDKTQAGAPHSLSAPQMNALVMFMSKLTAEKSAALRDAPADLLEGADIYVSNLCSSCHKVNGAGGQTGPSLNGLSERRSRQWVVRHFQAPRIMSPGSIMPPYHFASDEEGKLIAYLFQLP